MVNCCDLVILYFYKKTSKRKTINETKKKNGISYFQC